MYGDIHKLWELMVALVFVQSQMTTHFALVMPRVTLPSSGNTETDITQLFTADQWKLYHIQPPYMLDDLKLSQSQSNLITVELPAMNHLDVKGSFKRSGKYAISQC